MTSNVQYGMPLESIPLETSIAGHIPRPRAATVSMCRYTVPSSPITRPSASPPNSPPSLILPPPEKQGSFLMRSASRLSTVEERLAASAPTSSFILATADDCGPPLLPMDRPDPFTAGDFQLVECEGEDGLSNPISTPTLYLSMSGIAGMDDLADPVLNDERTCTSVAVEREEFAASPVLLSCLRDISRMSHSKVN